MEEVKSDPRSKFIEEFLTENPSKHILSEIGIALQDYTRAYIMMKNEGDSPTAKGLMLKNFQNCLLIAFSERLYGNMKLEN